MIKKCKTQESPIHPKQARLISRPVIQYYQSAHSVSENFHLKDFCSVAAQKIPEPITTPKPRKVYARKYINSWNAAPAPPKQKGKTKHRKSIIERKWV